MAIHLEQATFNSPTLPSPLALPLFLRSTYHQRLVRLPKLICSRYFKQASESRLGHQHGLAAWSISVEQQLGYRTCLYSGSIYLCSGSKRQILQIGELDIMIVVSI